jgi:DNA-binding winged helix-turn-helix (wHTH) protein/Tol biopolymer transport system component
VKVLSIDRVRFGAYEFDRANRLLSRDGVELALPPRAVGVLSCLLERPGQIVSKQALLDEVWKDANVTETSLTEAVSLLRQTLADDPQRPVFIQTVPRRGYRFVAPTQESSDEAMPVLLGKPLATATLDTRPAERPAAEGPTAERVVIGRSRDERSVVQRSADERSVVERSADERPAEAHTVDVASPRLADETAWPAWLPWLFVVVTIGALTGILVAVVRQPSTYTHPIVRFAIDLPADLHLRADGPAIALSRDGRRVAFVAARAGAAPRVYVRDMDRLDPIVLEDTDEAAAPFFSPDGRWVGFFANGALKKVSVAGGRAIALCPARAAFGAAWSTRRVIVFASSMTGGLSRVSEDGGSPVTMTTPDPEAGEVRHAWPALLPDDSGVIFTGVPLTGGPEAARVAAIVFDSNTVQTLVESATSPQASPSGHLVFARGESLLADPFDPQTLDLLGPAVPVLDGVAIDDATGAAQFALAFGGHVAAVRSAHPDTTAAYRWLHLDSGTSATSANASPIVTSPIVTSPIVTIPFPASGIRGSATSPDASRLAIALGDGHRTDLWLHDLARGGVQRLTNDGQNVDPIWSPDGHRVVYASRRDGPFNLFVKTIDEAAISPAQMLSSPHHQFPTSTSRAGLVFVDVQPKTGLDLWWLPWNSNAGASPRPLVQTPFDEAAGVISPDGRWLAYQSNESGQWEAVVRALDAPASRPATRIARTDGSALAWTPDGRALLFMHEGRLLHVTLTDAGSATAAPPRVIATDVDPTGGLTITSDGGVLVRTRDNTATTTSSRIDVVLDWSKELSVKVPVRPRTPKSVR